MKRKKWLLFTLTLLILITLGAMLAFERLGRQIYGQGTERVEPEQFRPLSKDVVITNVQVLSPDGARFLSNRSVYLQDGLITRIDSGRVIPGPGELIDGAGKFLIPGLIDAHVHLFKSSNDLLLYLANGVTQVRELIGEPAHLRWKKEIEAGRIGPRLFVASPRLGSFSAGQGLLMEKTQGFINVKNAESAGRIVKKLHRQGYDGIKVYSHLNRESYLAVTATARELGMPVFGHVPWQVSLEDIWENGQSGVAHLEELMNALSREFGRVHGREGEFLTYLEKRSAALARNLRQNDIAVTTTLWLTESFVRQKFELDQVLREVALEYQNPGISEWSPYIPGGLGWLPGVNRYTLPAGLSAEELEGQRKFWDTYARGCQILLKKLNDNGVMIMAGTDANLPPAVPGFSLHDELQSMYRAGMTNSEVLRSATQTPAQWLGIKSGQVAPGYRADLLLLDNNPLENIEHTRTISTVIANGRVYDRPLLDQMLQAVKVANDRSRKVAIQDYVGGIGMDMSMSK